MYARDLSDKIISDLLRFVFAVLARDVSDRARSYIIITCLHPVLARDIIIPTYQTGLGKTASLES